MQTAVGAIDVWLDARGRPLRVALAGVRYRVTDTPSPLLLDDFALTHPPTIPPGWRFQGTDHDGTSLVFDIRWQPSENRWGVEHCWG